ncbi:hypothetical protein [Nonomuraea sp. NPDC003804]|uniref:hypothetical protein n=1 Tax=Nonomuraea sp. NPDC003804 TaxID=3154547 RepID=UPI0033B4411C
MEENSYGWTPTRGRLVLARGESEKRAKEIAARTVNKERARAGESRTAGSGAGGRTKDQLYAEVKRRNIRGRSSMSRTELEKALS